jgi:hypothetical protein
MRTLGLPCCAVGRSLGRCDIIMIMLNRNHSMHGRSAVRSVNRSVVPRARLHVRRVGVAPSVINTNQTKSDHLTDHLTLKSFSSLVYGHFFPLIKRVSLFRMNIN